MPGATIPIVARGGPGPETANTGPETVGNHPETAFCLPGNRPRNRRNHPETPFCLPALFLVARTPPGNHFFAYPETPFIVARTPLLPPPHKLMFAYFVAVFLDWGTLDFMG